MATERSSPDVESLRSLLWAWLEADPRGATSVTRDERLELLQTLLGADLCRQLGVFRLPADFLLSVVIPVYNEARTIEQVLRRVRASGVPCEIIVIDDGSTDGTGKLLERHRHEPDLNLLRHETNRGKGAALKTGFLQAAGNVVIVQDADLEYDPRDYWRLIQPIVDGQADVVFGSRFRGDSQRVFHFWHYAGNRLLTLLSNVFNNLNLSDVETCYKAFRREAIDRLAPALVERGFGIEAELTAKAARLPGVRIFERPISYAGRTYAEGKKIGWRDGLWTLWCIVRYGLGGLFQQAVSRRAADATSWRR